MGGGRPGRLGACGTVGVYHGKENDSMDAQESQNDFKMTKILPSSPSIIFQSFCSVPVSNRGSLSREACCGPAISRDAAQLSPVSAKPWRVLRTEKLTSFFFATSLFHFLCVLQYSARLSFVRGLGDLSSLRPCHQALSTPTSSVHPV